MKAALLKNYGGPEQFEVKDIEAPSIQDGEILVKTVLHRSILSTWMLDKVS